MSGVLHATGDLVGGRYEVIDYIGQGGKQEVYRVHDRLLERDRPQVTQKSVGKEALQQERHFERPRQAR